MIEKYKLITPNIANKMEFFVFMFSIILSCGFPQFKITTIALFTKWTAIAYQRLRPYSYIYPKRIPRKSRGKNP